MANTGPSGEAAAQVLDLKELVGQAWMTVRWFFEQLVRQFLEFDCPSRAGALTYTTLFAVVPMMFVLPYFNRYFFRMTGSIYLGPMITCLIFVMILITNTVIYLPLE